MDPVKVQQAEAWKRIWMPMTYQGCEEDQEFANEDLSNWYIRRSRKILGIRTDRDKKAVYNTTYEILVGLSR